MWSKNWCSHWPTRGAFPVETLSVSWVSYSPWRNFYLCCRKKDGRQNAFIKKLLHWAENQESDLTSSSSHRRSQKAIAAVAGVNRCELTNRSEQSKTGSQSILLSDIRQALLLFSAFRCLFLPEGYACVAATPHRMPGMQVLSRWTVIAKWQLGLMCSVVFVTAHLLSCIPSCCTACVGSPYWANPIRSPYSHPILYPS